MLLTLEEETMLKMVETTTQSVEKYKKALKLHKSFLIPGLKK